jgi:hypothetical protein
MEYFKNLESSERNNHTVYQLTLAVYMRPFVQLFANDNWNCFEDIKFNVTFILTVVQFVRQDYLLRKRFDKDFLIFINSVFICRYGEKLASTLMLAFMNEHLLKTTLNELMLFVALIHATLQISIKVQGERKVL